MLNLILLSVLLTSQLAQAFSPRPALNLNIYKDEESSKWPNTRVSLPVNHTVFDDGQLKIIWQYRVKELMSADRDRVKYQLEGYCYALGVDTAQYMDLSEMALEQYQDSMGPPYFPKISCVWDIYEQPTFRYEQPTFKDTFNLEIKYESESKVYYYCTEGYDGGYSDSVDYSDYDNMIVDNCLADSERSTARFQGTAGQADHVGDFSAYWMREFNPKIETKNNNNAEDLILNVGWDYNVDVRVKVLRSGLTLEGGNIYDLAGQTEERSANFKISLRCPDDRCSEENATGYLTTTSSSSMRLIMVLSINLLILGLNVF